MAKKNKGKGKNKSTTVLSDTACPTCGAEMKESSAKLSFPINGEAIGVTDVTHLRCPECAEVILRLDESRKLRESANQTYRNKYHLLSGNDIRSIRERLGMTQEKFAELLCLGKNTVSRWESGRNVQTASMDIFLRLIRDVPESVDYLKSRVA